MTEHIDLIHLTHTDLGYTDHPVVCRELLGRYLDIAVDAVMRTREGPDEKKFYWTAESMVSVDDWWKTATPARRDEFLKAVRSGQLEIAAIAHNQTPTLDRRQWHYMLHWIPDDLWQQLQPKVAIQNDVNGLPRAGAVALLDRGIHCLWTGINPCFGCAPLSTPSAFWWKMPDGRRMFVWLGLTYCEGYYFFEDNWRQGPIPRATDARYRPPRAGDILGCDEASVRKSHRLTLEKIGELRARGYSYPTLALSTTNQWRMDNDPPFLPWADFVATWNRLGLKPTLRLTTASVAMKRLEDEIGKQIPVYEGEWTDWWANGVASGPREVAVSRFAKRMMTAARSPLWGKLDYNSRKTVDTIYKELCLFDEHTWGSSDSVAFPDSLDTLGQFNEKAGYAYRSMARAEWFLSQRVRTRLIGEAKGLYLANTSKLPFSGWIEMPVTCFREGYQSVEDPESGSTAKLHFESGRKSWERPQNPGELTRENTAAVFPDNCSRQLAKFWVEKLDGNTIRKLLLSTNPVEKEQVAEGSEPTVKVNCGGWPTSIVWPGMKRPLFLPGFGDFLAVNVRGFAPRWVLLDIWEKAGSAEGEKLRKDTLEEIPAEPEAEATLRETPHTLFYSQPIRHPRLKWATRELEVWKREPRVRFTLRLNRTSYESPELFFVQFPLPCEGTMPSTSNGGLPFVPFEDQLPGTCRDYFAIDGWIHYKTPDGSWLWVSRDAPLVTFGASQALARRKNPPKNINRVLAMIFNNFWFTNFVGDSHGVMQFQFDLMWKEKMDGSVGPQDLAESLLAQPQVMINPALREDSIVVERLYRP